MGADTTSYDSGRRALVARLLAHDFAVQLTGAVRVHPPTEELLAFNDELANALYASRPRGSIAARLADRRGHRIRVTSNVVEGQPVTTIASARGAEPLRKLVTAVRQQEEGRRTGTTDAGLLASTMYRPLIQSLRVLSAARRAERQIRRTVRSTRRRLRQLRS